MRWKLITCLALLTSIVSVYFAVSAEARSKRVIQRKIAAERAKLEQAMKQMIEAERKAYTNSVVLFASGRRGTRTQSANRTEPLYPVIPPKLVR